jgi:hypothetical protein
MFIQKNGEFQEELELNSAQGRNESIDERDELSHVLAPKGPTKSEPKLSQNGDQKY